jgi:hypothetical protein
MSSCLPLSMVLKISHCAPSGLPSAQSRKRTPQRGTPHQTPAACQRYRRAPGLQHEHGVPNVGHCLPERVAPPLLRQRCGLVLAGDEDVCARRARECASTAALAPCALTRPKERVLRPGEALSMHLKRRQQVAEGERPRVAQEARGACDVRAPERVRPRLRVPGLRLVAPQQLSVRSLEARTCACSSSA